MHKTSRQSVWVGIGSNLGDSLKHLDSALAALDALPNTQLLRRSRIYRTCPLPSSVKQEDYLNAVAVLQTQLSPFSLLENLLDIERIHGRSRQESCLKNHPRTLDLDMLLYNRLSISGPGLSLPHPRIAERGFVLVPLVDVDADLQMPDGTMIQALLNNLNDHGILGYFDCRGLYHPYHPTDHQPRCIHLNNPEKP